jgi:predicted porin
MDTCEGDGRRPCTHIIYTRKRKRINAWVSPYTGLKWNGVPGLELGISYQYQSDITQGEDPMAGKAGLIAAKGLWQRGPFGLKALYARWDLDGSGPEATGADTQEGYYIEPSLKVNPQLGIFARFNRWDNQAGNSGGSEKQQWDLGINYYPHPSIVIKGDYQYQDNEDNRNQNGINIGVGYQF